ncbi:MAG: glycosyltransferase family 2 protein [Patescibacteria group bacterium]
MPLVSVVIPVYNQAAYVGEAVQSALNQTLTDREVIVVNDGSTDGTAAVLAGFGERIRVFHKPNGGTSSALNLGISQATGRYVAWLSADDVFLPEKLHLQVNAMMHHPRAGLCYTDWYIIDGAGCITGQSGSPTFAGREAVVGGLLQGCCINGSTVLMLRSALARVGPFNEAYRQAHDYDMWLRFALYYEFVHVARPLLKYRWHGANLSLQADALAYNAEIIAKARQMHGR